MKNLLIATTFAVSLLAGNSFAQTPTKSPSKSDAPDEAKRPGDPIPGVGVNLVQDDGTLVKTTKTSVTGQFEFKDVKPGRYLLKVENVEKGTEASRINTSRSNIKTQKAAPTNDVPSASDEAPQTKAGVSTSRSNVRNRSAEQPSSPEEESVIAVQFSNEATPDTKRTHIVLHVIEKKGSVVNVPADGTLAGTVLKTRHDTVKNSINNVR